jgi:hypothetical protein
MSETPYKLPPAGYEFGRPGAAMSSSMRPRS